MPNKLLAVRCGLRGAKRYPKNASYEYAPRNSARSSLRCQLCTRAAVEATNAVTATTWTTWCGCRQQERPGCHSETTR
eukprot:14195883-Alexandrium_andersonii.AAC.1